VTDYYYFINIITHATGVERNESL